MKNLRFFPLLVLATELGCGDCPHEPCHGSEIVVEVSQSITLSGEEQLWTFHIDELRRKVGDREADLHLGPPLLTECLARQLTEKIRSGAGCASLCCESGANEDGSEQLISLLRMTPSNADVPESVEEMAASCGATDAHDLLAEVFGLSGNDPLISTEHLAASIQENLVDSHGRVGLVLDDLLYDWEHLKALLSPSLPADDTGGPPGFLACFEAPPFFDELSVRGRPYRTYFQGLDLEVGELTGSDLRQERIDFDYTTLEISSIGGMDPPTHPIVEGMRIQFRISDVPCPQGPGCGGVNGDPTSSMYWSAPRWSLEYILVDALRREYEHLSRTKADLSPDCWDGPVDFSIKDGWLDYAGPHRGEQGYVWDLMTTEIMKRFDGHEVISLPTPPVHLCESSVDLIAEAGAAIDRLEPPLEPELGDVASTTRFDVFFDKGTDGSSYLFGATESDAFEHRDTERPFVRFHKQRGDAGEARSGCGLEGELVFYEGVPRCRVQVDAGMSIWVESLLGDMVMLDVEQIVEDADEESISLRSRW